MFFTHIDPMGNIPDNPFSVLFSGHIHGRALAHVFAHIDPVGNVPDNTCSVLHHGDIQTSRIGCLWSHPWKATHWCMFSHRLTRWGTNLTTHFRCRIMETSRLPAMAISRQIHGRHPETDASLASTTPRTTSGRPKTGAVLLRAR